VTSVCENTVQHVRLVVGFSKGVISKAIQASFADFDCAVFSGPGYLSRCSDSLRAGQSGDRIPVEATFPAAVQTGRVAHPASCTVGTRFFPGGKVAGAWR
jgi:hypothetical protein